MKDEDTFLKKVEELLEIISTKAGRKEETAPYWGLGSAPTAEEICHAIRNDELTPWPEGGEAGPKVQGDRRWHIGRIAWLAVNWKEEGHPIEIKKDGKDLRGAHRVFAAHFLGKKVLATSFF